MTQATQTTLNPALPSQLSRAAAAVGIHVLATEPAISFAGEPTTRFTLALAADTPKERTLQLELSNSFDPGRSAEFGAQLELFLAETAQRLRTPRPNTFLTLTGIPLSYTAFAWPFHESTAGADTSLVHGQVNLEDGLDSPLHAKVSASMTVTFAEIVPAPEQPFAEAFIYNAVRKTMDQGQLELVKSGNRQPVPVTTRCYSARTQKFVFNDTTEAQRRAYLAAKAFWLSGVLGAGQPVWLLDPRDAQYLNATIAELKISVEALSKDGRIALDADPAYASPTAALMEREAEYRAELSAALAAIRPSFNEEMRGGHTNM